MGYADRPLIEYLNDASSAKPAPGGGSVSALVGALGSTMAQMSANLTVGKEEYRDVEGEVVELLERCQESCAKFLELMEKDIECYSVVAAAYKLPRGTPDEKAQRSRKIQEALKIAMQAPLEICRQALYFASSARSLAEIVNPRLLSDVGVAAVLARAAFQAAKLNVQVNLTSLKDRELVLKTSNEVEDAEREVNALVEVTLERVAKEIAGT